MKDLEQAIVVDLAPIGAHADRAAIYVMTGRGESVLTEIGGASLQLKLAHQWVDREALFALFTSAEDAPILERLGRVYAAVGEQKGVIPELEAERWVENLIWEASNVAPHISTQAHSSLHLSVIASCIDDLRPLIRAAFMPRRGLRAFVTEAFASAIVACRGAPDLFAKRHDELADVLRSTNALARADALDRLEQASVDVRALIPDLAEYAVSDAATVRRAATQLLARDPAAALEALNAIANARRTPSERDRANEAIGKLPNAKSVATIAESEARATPLSDESRRVLRAFCDEWTASVIAKFAAHRARVPKAPSWTIESVDDSSFDEMVRRIGEGQPWSDAPPRLLPSMRMRPTTEEILRVVRNAEFHPIHIARLFVLLARESAVTGLVAALGPSRLGTPRFFEIVRRAARFARLDIGEVNLLALRDGSLGDTAALDDLARHPEILETVLGARVESWYSFPSYFVRMYRQQAFRAIGHLDALPSALGDALWEIALRGSKADRPIAQKCLTTFGGLDARLVGALGDRSAEARSHAATWISRLKLPNARESLRAALRKEKTEATRAAIMEALEASGEPLDALMNREGLLENAEKVLAKAKCPVLDWPEIAALPPLSFADSAKPIDPRIIRAWIAETHKTKSPVPAPLLRLYARALGKDEREAFARALLDMWTARDTATSSTNGAGASAIDDKGILALVAAMGGSGIAERVAAFLKEYYGMRAAQCKALLQMLAHVDDKSAVQLLLAISMRFRTAGIRAEAETQAQTLAERKGWTLDEMADRTIPTGNLDEEGKLVIAYGEDKDARRFVVQLDSALRLVFLSDGVSIKALPAPRKDEDEAVTKSAKANFSRCKKEIESVIKMQRARFYEAMCTQRTWRFDEWETLLALHPIVRHLVLGIVWMAEQREETLGFRPLGDGSLSTADHRVVNPRSDAVVRIAHPLTMVPDQVEEWAAHLGDFEVLAPFPQFGRPLHVVPESERGAREMNGFLGHMVEAYKLRSRAIALGYVRGPSEDGGWFTRYCKALPSLGYQAVLGFSGNPLPEENHTVALMGVTFERTGEDRDVPVLLGDLPPVLLSEAHADMAEIAATGSGFDPAWESKVQ